MEKIENTNRKNDAYRLFFEAMFEGGVEKIISVASELFESPVLFTDENYRLICQVPRKPIGNPVWDTLYETKTLPSDLISEYQKIFLNNQINVYKPFYANWGLVEDAPRIFGEVYKNNKILGHIAIFLMDKPKRDDDIEIAQIFINALNIEILRKGTESVRWHTSASTCLLDLINKDESYQVKQRAIEILEKKIVGNYTIIVTPTGVRASQKAFSTYAVAELPLLYRNLVSVIHDDCIVTLIGEVNLEKNHRESKFINSIVGFLAEHNLTSGICDGFVDLREIPLRYRQSYLTAKLAIAQHDFPLGIFKEYAPMQMFFNIAHLDVPEVYTHPILEKIKRYDQKNNTEYFDTLRIYSLSMHNKEVSAKKISIHRNTLLYRLNRIRDIFDLSYEDEKTALHLLCSFLLLDANQI